MNNLYILVSICGFLHPLETQYINIWRDNMDTNNEWIGYNDFSFTFISDKCILSPCSYVAAKRNGVSYIEKQNTNISVYSFIQFQLDINAYGINQTDYCQIWYKYDRTRYVKHSEFTNGKYTNITVTFPPVTTAKILFIKLQVIGNNGTCYFDNAILKGTIPADQKLFSDSPSIPMLWILIVIFTIILVTCVCCTVIVICEVCDKKNSIESVHNPIEDITISKKDDKTDVKSVQNEIKDVEYEMINKLILKLKMLEYEANNTTANQSENESVSNIKNPRWSTSDNYSTETDRVNFGSLSLQIDPKLSVSKLEHMLNGDEVSPQVTPNTINEMYSQYTRYPQLPLLF